MKKNKARTFEELRSRAEDWLGVDANKLASGDRSPAADTYRLIHELHVHQIELEMQNEELQRVQAELESSLARLTEMYEFAPVGYMTLDAKGVLREVNLTGSRMLALERARLVGRRFAHLLPVESRAAFDGFLAKVFESRNKELCELALRPDGADVLVLELIAVASNDGQECHLMATDITRRKRAEERCDALELQLSSS